LLDVAGRKQKCGVKNAVQGENAKNEGDRLGELHKHIANLSQKYCNAGGQIKLS
jgi:hypothetical protein